MSSFEKSNSVNVDLRELVDMALETFKTQADAEGWMNAKHPLLNSMSPREAARSEVGAKRVAEILTALKWGGVV